LRAGRSSSLLDDYTVRSRQNLIEDLAGHGPAEQIALGERVSQDPTCVDRQGEHEPTTWTLTVATMSGLHAHGVVAHEARHAPNRMLARNDEEGPYVLIHRVAQQPDPASPRYCLPTSNPT
jgi:hypothetical protein